MGGNSNICQTSGFLSVQAGISAVDLICYRPNAWEFHVELKLPSIIYIFTLPVQVWIWTYSGQELFSVRL